MIRGIGKRVVSRPVLKLLMGKIQWFTLVKPLGQVVTLRGSIFGKQKLAMRDEPNIGFKVLKGSLIRYHKGCWFHYNCRDGGH